MEISTDQVFVRGTAKESRVTDQSDQPHDGTEIANQPIMPSDENFTGIDTSTEARNSSSVAPLAASGGQFVYALGRIEPRFPTLGIEKEFAQVMGRGETSELTDREALRSLLSERSNRYLSRKLCWVFTVLGLETYVIVPRDPVDFELLVGALRDIPRPTDLDVLIGTLGPIASPDYCNGLMVPIVIFDHLYSFDVHSLISAIPRPKGVKAEDFEPTAEELLYRIMKIGDNAGATRSDRALNYLAVRYPAIYHKTVDRFAADASLTNVEVRPSALSGTRSIVDVIFGYTDRKTDVTEKHYVRVDVTEEFPFLVTKLSPYFDIST
jgi:hypothetical protein